MAVGGPEFLPKYVLLLTTLGRRRVYLSYGKRGQIFPLEPVIEESTILIPFKNLPVAGTVVVSQSGNSKKKDNKNSD